jgi:hypothetical protein
MLASDEAPILLDQSVLLFFGLAIQAATVHWLCL